MFICSGERVYIAVILVQTSYMRFSPGDNRTREWPSIEGSDAVVVAFTRV